MQLEEVIFDAAYAAFRQEGMSDEQIMQWAKDSCHCDNCRRKRGQAPRERFHIEHPLCGKAVHPDYYPLIITDVIYMVSRAFQAKKRGRSPHCQ